jgi:hypothetical protein
MRDENGKVIEVHPYAARFPLMSEEELDKLADDIKANGLNYPVTRDADGTLLDGRNRKLACERAKVKLTETVLNGEDPISFIISHNIERRNLNRGQQAMLRALGMIHNESVSQRQIARETGLGQGRISKACFIIEHAPDKVDSVLSGGSLEAVYEEAQSSKREAESEQSRTERLVKASPELAEQVADGTLTLAEAIGVLDARENEAKEKEKNQRETIYRVAEDSYRNIIAWAVADFTDGIRERLKDKEFRDTFLKRVRLNNEEIPLIAQGAKALAKILKSL